MVSRTTGPDVLRVFHRCICVQTCVWDQPWPHVGLFTALWLDRSIYCTIRCTVMEMWCNNGIMCLVKALLAPNSSSASFPRKDMCWGAPAGSCSLPKQCSQMCVFPLQMEWNTLPISALRPGSTIHLPVSYWPILTPGDAHISWQGLCVFTESYWAPAVLTPACHYYKGALLAGSVENRSY